MIVELSLPVLADSQCECGQPAMTDMAVVVASRPGDISGPDPICKQCAVKAHAAPALGVFLIRVTTA